MHVDERERFCYFRPSKVLAIGGERGSMAWADLRKGILTCALLGLDDANGAVLGHIPLPQAERKGRSEDVWGWDVAIVQGRIKFFEMRFKLKGQGLTSTTALVTKCWKSTAWEKADPCQQWRKDCGLNIFKVPVGMSHPELSSHLHDMGKLNGRSQPAISLHEEDVVYIMVRAERNPDLKFHEENAGNGMAESRRAWILAIDVRKKTLREVATLDAGRTDALEFSIPSEWDIQVQYMSCIESSNSNR